MNWTVIFAIFCAGWFFGASLMWWHFVRNDMIRSREEWYEAHPELKSHESD